MDVSDPSDLGTKGSPSPTTWCGLCEFRKKLLRDRRLRRNSGAPAPPPEALMSMPSFGDISRLALEQKQTARARPRRGKKRPLSVEQERGYRECDVGKKVMRHKWDGLHHKWAALCWDSPPEMAGFGATAGPSDLLEKMMLVVQKLLHVDDAKLNGLRHKWAGLLPWDSPPEMAGFGAMAEPSDLLEEMLLVVQKFLHVDDAKLNGLRRKWAGLLPWDSPPEMAGFGATAGPRDLLEKMMLVVQNSLHVDDAKLNGLHHKWAGLPWDSTPEVAYFDPATGRHELLEKMVLFGQNALRVDDAKLAPPQGAQKPSFSAAARVDVLQEKLAQMTKVLTKVLHEEAVLQVSTKLMRLLCPDVGSRTASGGGLDGSDWVLVEEAIDNLVNQTRDGMQDIVKTVIPKLFSKESLYDLIMACVGRYPKLLEDDKGKLTKEKYKQYQKQLDLMVNLTTVYENDPENFSKIMKLICKIGRCGPLPSEVIDDISPGLDPSTMEQLYSGMLERLHNVDRASPVDTNPFSK